MLGVDMFVFAKHAKDESSIVVYAVADFVAIDPLSISPVMKKPPDTGVNIQEVLDGRRKVCDDG